MPNDSLDDALVRARSLLIDLERHVDRGAAEHDLAEIGRAWVRAAQVERLLRSVLPADAIKGLQDAPDPSHDGGPRAGAAHGGDNAARSSS